jgi:hypothetical protein
MTARRGTRFLLLALCGAGALVLAGCSSGGSPTASGTSTTTTTSGKSGATVVTAAPITTTTTTSTTSTTSGAAQNLVATAAVKSALTATYVAHNNLPADEVAGTAPNSVYYGFLPSTNTYWAIASFVPTSTASTQTQVSMQDDGCCGVFSMPSGGSWTYVAPFLGTPCPGQVPAQLSDLWHLTFGGDCANVTTTTS